MQFHGQLRSWATRVLLGYRSRPALVVQALADRSFRRVSPAAGGRLRVAALQCQLHPARTAAEYARQAYTLTLAAAAHGAQLLCFPEHHGTALLSLHPAGAALLGLAGTAPASDQQPPLACGASQAQLAGLVRLAGPAARRVFEATWSSLARGFGVYIVAGSLWLPDRSGRIYHTLLAYAPDGTRLGLQHKLNLGLHELAWVAPGTELTLLSLPTTRLAAPIGLDLAYWQTARLASAHGAELLVGPLASDEPAAWWLQARGLWGRVQEVGCYGIQPMLVGQLLGRQLRGYSAIYAPLALSPEGDGILALAESEERQQVVLADLDLAALRRQRQAALRPRAALLGRYLPQLHAATSERRSAPEEQETHAAS